MTRYSKTKGKCFYCGESYEKGGMTRHLKACKSRQEAIEAYQKKSRAKVDDIFHLVVEGTYNPYYWLHLDVPAKRTLTDLDGFLREIWLECCGHMSRFEIEGESYSVYPMEEYNEHTMDHKLGDVLETGMEFFHEYDFGSTTELRLRVREKREGKPSKGVDVLARNLPPDIRCQSCREKPAKWINVFADYDDAMWFCDDCAPMESEEDAEGFLPNVNSPRVGVCAYSGPQKKDPYAT